MVALVRNVNILSCFGYKNMLVGRMKIAIPGIERPSKTWWSTFGKEICFSRLHAAIKIGLNVCFLISFDSCFIIKSWTGDFLHQPVFFILLFFPGNWSESVMKWKSFWWKTSPSFFLGMSRTLEIVEQASFLFGKFESSYLALRTSAISFLESQKCKWNQFQVSSSEICFLIS